MENIAYFNNLKQINLEIHERTTIKPAIKKLAELRGGRQAILEQYTGIYTDKVLSEILEDYYHQKISKINVELGAYDEYSKLLVDRANMYINKLESKKLDVPTTKYELPVDYQTVQEIKKDINNSIGLIRGQLHQFNLLNNIDKCEEKI